MDNPLTVIGEDAPLVETACGFEVTVYEKTGEPPSSSGGLKLTVAWAFPAVAEALRGTLGADKPVPANCSEYDGESYRSVVKDSVPLRVPGPVGVNTVSIEHDVPCGTCPQSLELAK